MKHSGGRLREGLGWLFFKGSAIPMFGAPKFRQVPMNFPSDEVEKIIRAASTQKKEGFICP